MSEFKGVTVVKKANVFFGGGVTSRTVLFEDGSRRPLASCNPENMNSPQMMLRSWKY